MDIRIIISIISFLGVAGCVIYLLLSRKRRLLSLMNGIQTQLLKAGVESSIKINKNDYLEKLGNTIRMIDSDMEGVCDIRGQDFDYICYWSRAGASASTSEDYLHYIVIGNTSESEGKKTNWIDNIFYQRVTQLSIDKGILPWGKISKVFWKGDARLTQELNADTDLIGKLTPLLRRTKQPRSIFIYLKNKYAVIRTPIYTITADDLEITNTIARHIKTAWFVC